MLDLRWSRRWRSEPGHASCTKEQTSNFEEWLFASVKLPSAQGVRERTAFLSVVHDFSDGLFPYYVHPANGWRRKRVPN